MRAIESGMDQTGLPTKRLCEVCGGDRSVPLPAPWDVLRCLDCGLVFACGLASAGVTEPLYEEKFARGNKHPTYMFDGAAYAPRAGERWATLLQELERFRKPGRILDIGCSLGFLLHQAQERGWEAYGLEVSAYAANYAQQHFGIKIHLGILEEHTYPHEFFDAVICSHVIEHVPSPRELLRRIHEILRPGGVALILVPTQFVSLSYKVLGRVRGEGPPKHLYFFSRRTLLALLQQEGFVVLESEMNTQLTELLGSLTRSKRVEETLGRQSEKIVSRAPQTLWERARGRGVRAAKSLVNRLGTQFDFGDELTTYAEKRTG